MDDHKSIFGNVFLLFYFMERLFIEKEKNHSTKNYVTKCGHHEPTKFNGFILVFSFILDMQNIFNNSRGEIKFD